MRPACERGYAMAALLVALNVMAILLAMALPAWRTFVQREREAELIFRGEQYAQAVALFSRRTGGFPTSFDALRDGRYIRKLYKDPITGGDFRPVFLGQVAMQTPPTPGGRGAGAALPGRVGQPAGAVAQPAAGVGRGAGTPATPLGRAGQTPPGGIPGGIPGQPEITSGPIIGVVSRSAAESIRMYNGRTRYNEWLFVSTAATTQAGAPTGAAMPGIPGRGTGPAGRGRGPIPGGRGAPGRGPGRMQPPYGPGGGFPNLPLGPGRRGRL